MRHIVICDLPHSTIFFSHCLINGMNFELKKNVIEHKTCIASFSTNLSETFLIIRRTERDVIKMYIGLNVKYPLF